MPAAQDGVHVLPVEGALFEDGLLIGQGDGLVVKAHLDPGVDVLPLALHRHPAGDTQQGQQPGLPAPEGGEGPDVGVGRLGGVHPQPPPHKGLLAELGHPGLSARTVLPLGLLDAPGGQQQDDLRRQGQIVEHGIEHFEVGGGEDLPQPPLQLPDQVGEGPRALHLPGDVGGGVVRGAVRLRRRLGGGEVGILSGQAQVDQLGVGGGDPVRRPAQGLPHPLGVELSPLPEELEVEQRGVPAAGADQALRRRRRHGQYPAWEQHPCRHRHLLLPSFFAEPILSQNPSEGKTNFSQRPATAPGKGGRPLSRRVEL